VDHCPCSIARPFPVQGLFLGDDRRVIGRDDIVSLPRPDHQNFPGSRQNGSETAAGCLMHETYDELALYRTKVDLSEDTRETGPHKQSPPRSVAGGVNEPQEEPARWGVSPRVNFAAKASFHKVWNTRPCAYKTACTQMSTLILGKFP
jgi:hypothetical protein